MPFNFGSLFSAVGRALPGFIEGERQAVRDNWNDLNQYNRVQAGQLENAWTEATWQPRLDNVHYQTANNDIMLQASGMELANRMAAQPAMQARAWRLSEIAPDFYADYYRMLRQSMNRFPQLGAALSDPALGLNTPSLGR